MADGPWTTVRRSRKSAPRVSAPVAVPVSSLSSRKATRSSTELVALLAARMAELDRNWEFLVRTFEVALADVAAVESEASEVVFYGVGRFSEFRGAQFQVALLILWLRRSKRSWFWFYDPLMSVEERLAVENFGGRWIGENEEGKRKLSEDLELTMFYMPHCGKALYNNVLWANWNEKLLQKAVIVGNSFAGYMDAIAPTRRGLSDREKGTGECIRRVVESGCLQENIFQNQFDVIGAFNDMSFHRFRFDGTANSALGDRPPEYFADGNCDTIIPAKGTVRIHLD